MSEYLDLSKLISEATNDKEIRALLPRINALSDADRADLLESAALLFPDAIIEDERASA